MPCHKAPPPAVPSPPTARHAPGALHVLLSGMALQSLQSRLAVFFSSDNLTNLWRCVHAALSLCPPPRTSPYLPPRQTPPRHPAPSPFLPGHYPSATIGLLQALPQDQGHPLSSRSPPTHCTTMLTSPPPVTTAAGAPRPVKLSLQPADCWLQGKIHPLVIHHFTLL